MSTATTVLVFGSFDESMHPRIKVIRQGLESHGVAVAIHNAPVGVSTHQRVDAARRPRKLVGLGFRLIRSWAKLVALRVRGGTAPIVIVGYLGHVDVHLARLLHRRSIIVLDYLISLAETTVDREIDGPIRKLLHTVDELALRQADLVLCDTDEQRATLPEHARSKALTVLVGAPLEWQGSAARVSTEGLSGPLRIVFFGLYTPLQGTTVIAEAIRSALDQGCDLRLTMIGSGQDRESVDRLLDGLPEVEFIDWVSSDDLPGVVASHDVTLGIFGTSSKAQRVIPNKVFQGLAAGTIVVTSDTDAQRSMLGDACRYVPIGSAADLTDVLVALARDHSAKTGTVTDRTNDSKVERLWHPRHVVAPLLDRLRMTDTDLVQGDPA